MQVCFLNTLQRVQLMAVSKKKHYFDINLAVLQEI